MIGRPFLSQEQRMKEPCSRCGQGPLNGKGANTPSGLLRLADKNCVRYVPAAISVNCACPTKTSVNTEITPSEGSRIDSIRYGCYGSAKGVTQARVKELLTRTNNGLQFGNEGTRITRLQEITQSCSSDSVLKRPIILEQCPPLPPPPAPPARACPLTKNQK